MRIAIAGGHGAIDLHIQRQLSALNAPSAFHETGERAHEAIAIIRNPEHAADVLVAGGIPVVIDLETVDAHTLATDLKGVDAVVFAAGAGPGSSAERKFTVDRDAAILLADAAQQAGITRYVLISSMGADAYDPDSTDVFQIYLRAKGEADANIRARSSLDYTIIRPGGLTDDPAQGTVELAESTGRGTIPRADVAALVVAALIDGIAIRAQFEAISGDTPIPDALAAVRY